MTSPFVLIHAVYRGLFILANTARQEYELQQQRLKKIRIFHESHDRFFSFSAEGNTVRICGSKLIQQRRRHLANGLVEFFFLSIGPIQTTMSQDRSNQHLLITQSCFSNIVDMSVKTKICFWEMTNRRKSRILLMNLTGGKHYSNILAGNFRL